MKSFLHIRKIFTTLGRGIVMLLKDLIALVKNKKMNSQTKHITTTIKAFKAIALVAMLGVLPAVGFGVAITASVSGNWNSTATWGGSAVPTSADDVTINTNISVTLDVDAVCKSITINTYNNGTAKFIMNDKNLTVYGNATLKCNSQMPITTSGGYFIMDGTNGASSILSDGNCTLTIPNLRLTNNAAVSCGDHNQSLSVTNFDCQTGVSTFTNTCASYNGGPMSVITGSCTAPNCTFIVANSHVSGFNFSGGADPIYVGSITNAAGSTVNFGSKTIISTTAFSGNTAGISYDPAKFTIGTSSPTITSSSSTLTGFSYVFGSGPSTSQTFTLSGASLTNDVTVTAPASADYDISTNSGFSNSSPLTLTRSGTTLSGQPITIYVRLKSPLGVGSYNSENIVLSSSGASNVNVACSGSVTAVPTVLVAAGSAVAAGNISQNTTNNIVSTIKMTVTNAPATVSQIVFANSMGNAVYTTDITNYKLYYTGTSNSFASTTCLGTITSGTTFTGFTQNVAIGDGYFWITADMTTGATSGRTITVDAISNTSITITGASISGSNSAGGTKTIVATAPVVTLADNTVVPAGNIMKNSTNNIISRFTLSASSANTATVTAITFSTAGTAVSATDLTNFKLWYSSTNNFTTPAPTQLSTITTTLGAGSHSFTGLTQVIPFSTTGYFWITADIATGATNNSTVAVSAMTNAAITLSTGSVSGSTNISGLQTIITAVPKSYYYVGVTGGNWSTASNWNTGSCGSGVVNGFPTINDYVYITCNNDRVVQLSANSACASLTIGQQNSGVDLYGNSLTIAGNVDFGAGNANRFTNTAGSGNTLSIGGNLLLDNSYQGYMNIPGYSVSVGGNVLLSKDQSYLSTTTGAINITGNFIGGYQANITTTTGNVTINGTVTFSGSQAKIITSSGNVTIVGTYTNTAGSESRIEWGTGTTTITGNISVTLSNGQEPLKCTGTGWFEMNGGLSQTITASNNVSIPKFRQSNTGFTKAGAGILTVSNIFDQNCGPVAPANVTITTPANTIHTTCGIILTNTTLSNFNYILGSGPSAVQSFTVQGITLNGDIVLNAPTHYVISTASGSGFTNTITLTQSSNAVPITPIYVRLIAGLSANTYNSENISLTSSGHASKTISCNGKVNAPVSATRSTLLPTTSSIAADGITTQILTVQAKDENNENITSGGLTVVFTQALPKIGTLSSVTDNGNGTYTATVTSISLGTDIFTATLNGSQVQNNSGSQTQATISYIAGAPTQIVQNSITSQTAFAGCSVTTQPSVIVKDALGNPVSGVTVTFGVGSGGGSVTGATQTTGVNGVATVGSWTLGTLGTDTLVVNATAVTSTAAIQYPFPQAACRKTYPYGIVASHPDYNRYQTLLNTWISNFYVEGKTTGGNVHDVECARIKWDDPTISVSEGIAYGMLIFVYSDNTANNYKTKFDKLWKYYNNYRSGGTGLMDWRIDGFANVSSLAYSTGGATDADMDVAIALIQADKQWGSSGAINYLARANDMLNLIRSQEVNASNLFKPGSSWDDVENPSYAELFAINLANTVQPSNNWGAVYTAMKNYVEYYQNTTTGLWPNWTDPNASGDKTGRAAGYNNSDNKCGGTYNQGKLYGIDALRVPWRIAWDYAWYGTQSSKDRCDVLANWLRGTTNNGPGNDPKKVLGMYNLDGTRSNLCTDIAGKINGMGYMGGFTHAFMTNVTQQANLDTWYEYIQDTTLAVATINDSYTGTTFADYYNPTLQLLYLLTVSGNTPDFNALNPVITSIPVKFNSTKVSIAYSENNKDLSNSSNWWTETNASGGHPCNFTTSGTTFIVQNGHAGCTMSSNVAIGSGVTLQVNGTLTPSASAVISGAGTLNGSGTIAVSKVGASSANDDFDNQYTISNKTISNLTVEYNGTAAQYIKNVHAFNNLKISNATGVILNNSSITATNLVLNTGKLTLGSNTLTVGSTTGGSSNSYVYTDSSITVAGYLKILNVGNSNVTFPVGRISSYTPCYIQNSGTPRDFTVRVFDGVYANGLTGTRYTGASADTKLKMAWEITPNNATDVNAQIILQWNGTIDEGTSFALNRTSAYYIKNRHISGDDTWKQITSSFSSPSTGIYQLLATNVTTFSLNTGQEGNGLPIELFSFTAKETIDGILLNWITASEINNDYFVLERSIDGITWEEIYTCKGAGTSTKINHYGFVDYERQSSTVYYKLKQVDFDGNYSYSNIVSVTNNVEPSKINVFPNPFDGRNIYITGLRDKEFAITIYNVLGKCVYTTNIKLDGEVVVILDLDDQLPIGSYIIKLQSADQVFIKHLMVGKSD